MKHESWWNHHSVSKFLSKNRTLFSPPSLKLMNHVFSIFHIHIQTKRTKESKTQNNSLPQKNAAFHDHGAAFTKAWYSLSGEDLRVKKIGKVWVVIAVGSAAVSVTNKNRTVVKGFIQPNTVCVWFDLSTWRILVLIIVFDHLNL